MTSPGEKRLW